MVTLRLRELNFAQGLTSFRSQVSLYQVLFLPLWSTSVLQLINDCVLAMAPQHRAPTIPTAPHMDPRVSPWSWSLCLIYTLALPASLKLPSLPPWPWLFFSLLPCPAQFCHQALNIIHWAPCLGCGPEAWA
jgi:hypothetical protein